MKTFGIDSVRRLVVETFTHLSDRPSAPIALVERTLQHGPERVGRRFQYRQLRAVWFSDSDAIDFFTDDGRPLTSVAFAPNMAAPVAA
jgi:hypothetical protein